MAKKPTSKTDERTDAAGDEANATVVYSTRCRPDQKDLIERAARELNVTPAKFIREAAVLRAAEVVNASGQAKHRLRGLAGVVVNQLLNPPILYHEQVGPDEYETHRMSYSAFESMDEMEMRARGLNAAPSRPEDGEIRQIKRALETSGAEFVRMMLEQWQAFGSGSAEYEPLVDPKDLLSGDDAE